MTANVSTYVKYVNTFVCPTYLCKVVVLCHQQVDMDMQSTTILHK